MLNTRAANPTTQDIMEVTPPSATSAPRGIAIASNGSAWFTEVNSAKVATVVPSLQIVVTSGPPVHVQLGETFGMTVAIEDDSGGVDTGYSGNVTLSSQGSGVVGSLEGTTSISAVNGVASFSGLSLVHAGSFWIQVQSGSITATTTGPINVTGPVGSSPVGPKGAAPIVVGETLEMAGHRGSRYVAGIVLTFSSPLDVATAQNAANYTVTQMGTNGRAKAVKAIRLHAIYSAALKRVTLRLAGKPRFAAGGQLVVVGSGPAGIASASGVQLEGNTGSNPGANGLYMILPNGRGITT
jgi:hypothetical protein